MNYKLLLGLILLGVIIFPYLPATTQVVGQFPSTVEWGAVTQQDVGILLVARGDYDIFLFSNPLFWYNALAPDVRANLTLIRTATTYIDIVFNPAQNVIDANLPDEQEFAEANFPGYFIPGLLVVDPDAIGLNMTPTWMVVNWTDIDPTNPTHMANLHFNPVAIREIRFAFNYLIDRAVITDQIYQGSAVPKYGAIGYFHPYYSYIEDVYFQQFQFSATGDVQRAVQIYENALAQVNATLAGNYGMYLYFKPDPNAPGGEWLYFVKPDGSEEPVVINFYIRTEDERKDVGLQIADWIETYFRIRVNRILRDRTYVSIVYFSNPVKTYTAFDGNWWTMYTEGWVTMGESLDVWARYTVTWFYLPFGGLYPNAFYGAYLGWYWYNKTLHDAELLLDYGTYTDANVLKQDIRTWFIEGLKQAIRVFIADTLEYFAANKNSLAQIVPGLASGLYTPWALRTLRTYKATARLLEFSAEGTLFMSPWNPVMGFTDIYSELMHAMLTDYDLYARPDTAIPEPIRVESYTITRGVIPPDADAYIFYSVNDTWVEIKTFFTQAYNELQWLLNELNQTYHFNGTIFTYDDINWTYVQQNATLWNAVKELVYAKYIYEDWGGYYLPDVLTWNAAGFKAPNPLIKVTVNYILGRWHDGSDITMADILYTWAFTWEWAFPDNYITGEADPYYDSQLESALQGYATVYGIRVENATALTVYVDYDDVYDELVVDYAVGWPDMPWHVMAAAEELIATQALAPTGYPYGWTDTESTTGISFIDPNHATDVRNMLNDFYNNVTIPHAVSYLDDYPFAGLLADNYTRYQNAINFITTYGHAYISSGPYYVESYDPTTYTLTMRLFPDYPINRTEWLTKFTVKTVSVVASTVESTVWVAFNDSLRFRIDIKFYQITPSYQELPIDPNKVSVKLSLYYYNGTWLADVPSQYITIYPNGTIVADIPASWIRSVWPTGGTPGYIVYSVSHEESPTTLTGYVETDIISTATPPPVPEPSLLPLLVLVALLAFILIIRRK